MPRHPRQEWLQRAHARSGMSLLEIMVVIAIMAAVLGIGVPSLTAILDVQQRGAARELAQTFRFLQDEATMRNVSFRVAFNLDTNSYQVEVGDPNTLVFSDPAAREAYESEREQQVKRFTRKEVEEGKAAETDAHGRFQGLDVPGFQSKVQLPEGTQIAWAWTPQYAEPVTPNTDASARPEDQRMVYSYVFASGEAEHTVIRLVDADDPEDGYTIEVEPLSGNITVETEVTEIGARMAWMPTEGPTIR